jgi:hypothetical protein
LDRLVESQRTDQNCRDDNCINNSYIHARRLLSLLLGHLFNLQRAHELCNLVIRKVGDYALSKISLFDSAWWYNKVMALEECLLIGQIRHLLQRHDIKSYQTMTIIQRCSSKSSHSRINKLCSLAARVPLLPRGHKPGDQEEPTLRRKKQRRSFGRFSGSQFFVSPSLSVVAKA